MNILLFDIKTKKPIFNTKILDKLTEIQLIVLNQEIIEKIYEIRKKEIKKER